MTRGTHPAALGTMVSPWTTVGQVTVSRDGQFALTPVRVSVVLDPRARRGCDARHVGMLGSIKLVQQSCTSRCKRSEVTLSQRVIKP